ncbi:hypothetical protein [Flavobacterium sp. GCM10023249]|uniref:hypothetical protein n=1 Tax=unclassified Flavobacterium TaxID=196869 RepID=UPI0036094162
MMTIEQESGLHPGLNGLKIGKFIKKNIKSAKKDISIKNIGKVVKVAAPIATSLIPVSGGLVNKMLTSKIGKKASKIANSKAVKKIKNVVNTGKKLQSSLVKPKAPQTSFNYMGATQQPVAQSVAEQSGTSIYQEQFSELPNIEKVDYSTPETTPLPTEPKDNTLLYVAGGLTLVGAIYFATKK